MPEQQRVAFAPNIELAEHLCKVLPIWFGGTWSHSLDHDLENYALNVRDLEESRVAKAKYYVIGFVSGVDYLKDKEQKDD